MCQQATVINLLQGKYKMTLILKNVLVYSRHLSESFFMDLSENAPRRIRTVMTKLKVNMVNYSLSPEYLLSKVMS
jgi:hypothetical protein